MSRFLMVAFVLCLATGCDSEKPLTHQEQVESAFSVWDGSHRGLVRYVKERMDDPDSFEHIETTFGESGEDVVVKMKFRGNNKLGVKILQLASARCTIEGEVIDFELEENPPQ